MEEAPSNSPSMFSRFFTFLACCHGGKDGKKMVDLASEAVIRSNEDISIGGRQGGVVNAWYAINEQEDEVLPLMELGKPYPSQENTIQEIQQCLLEPDVTSIRIVGRRRGEGGITWIMLHVMNRVREFLQFDFCIRLTEYDLVSFERALKKIARGLHMELNEENYDYDAVASQILGGLGKIKLLLFFDASLGFTEREPTVRESAMRDVVSKILDMGPIDSDEQDTIKFVFRSSGFEFDKEIRVNDLSNKEAWELFNENAGSVVNSPRIQPLARRVINICRGNPSKIIIVGRALRNEEDNSVWQEALTQLLYDLNCVQFCYKRMSSAKLRKCLLYCSLFPIQFDIYIHDLIAYWIMEGFVVNGDQITEAKAYTDGFAILKELLDHSLLKRVSNNCVAVDSVVRNFIIDLKNVINALRSANDATRSSTFEDVVVYCDADNVEREDYAKLSLIDQSIQGLELPPSPTCPILSTLLLAGNPLSQGFHTGFFEYMPALRVLDLSDTLLELLPPSLTGLHSLRALLLRRCKLLGSLDCILELKQLEILLFSGCKRLSKILDSFFEHMHGLRVLDFSDTSIESLPSSLSRLHRLHTLLLRHCEHLKNMEHVLVLEQLKVLLLSNCKSLGETLNPSFQHMKGLQVLDLSGTSIKTFPYEILTSTRLKLLDLSNTRHIGEVEWNKMHCLPKTLNWGQCGLVSPLLDQLGESGGASIYANNADFFQYLENGSPLWTTSLVRFHFCVFSHQEQKEVTNTYFQAKRFPYKDIYFRAKYFALIPSHNKYLEIHDTTSFPKGIGGVLGHLEMLSIHYNKFFSQILDLGVENSMELKTLAVEGCHEIPCIFGGEKPKDGMLACLENIFASNLLNMKSLCEGSIGQGCFMYLKQVYLDCCPNLVYVFPPSLVLGNLVKLEIKFCDKLEAIFEEELVGECALPMLQTLCLWELPKLKIICGGDLPLLKALKVRECLNLQELPLGDHIPNSSLAIQGESKWWEALRWKDNHMKSHIQFYKWDHF